MARFELCCKAHFSAAHQLRGYDGDCARLHGHNWHVRLYVECAQLDALGMGIDYKIMKAELKRALAQWDHYHLNDVPPFDTINPTSENVAAELYRILAPRINDGRVRVSRIEIAETCTASVTYWP
ncbi:MAG: 6-carboxytetrahydropterin synthase QueD [Zetaproteobacteria bacterium]|nr:MAG: 6-carboxytetrahydropterin synthase QueD [Zetaproteobacteria bacterium]